MISNNTQRRRGRPVNHVVNYEDELELSLPRVRLNAPGRERPRNLNNLQPNIHGHDNRNQWNAVEIMPVVKEFEI